MSSEEWAAIKARITEMEQIVRALRKLRLQATLSQSVADPLDNAIAEYEKRVIQLKQAMVN